jgi:hypothetical protein
VHAALAFSIVILCKVKVQCLRHALCFAFADFISPLQPDQARIVGLNAQYFLKNGGHYVISIKASCIDSTAQPEAVFAREVKKLQEMQLKPREQVRLVNSICCNCVLAENVLAFTVCWATAKECS